MTRTISALLAAASLVLAGCSGAGGDAPTGGSAGDRPVPADRSPLTGLPVEGDAPRDSVVVVKVDNTEASSPQIGLGAADLVAEELVEGGSTRLAVFYHSTLADEVGPVRSFRATDIGIVKPADAVLVGSGGAGPTVRRIREAEVRTVTQDVTGYYRDGNRVSPYNLFVRLPELAGELESGGAPDHYFSWAEDGDFPSGRSASGMAVRFSGGHTTSWRYRGGSYVNLDGNAPENDQFEPSTVLVLRVKVGDAGYMDPAGNPVPESSLNGKGRALIFHGGELVRAGWSKDGFGAQLELEHKGEDLAMPPGRVWMELVPRNDGSVTVTR